MKVQATVHSTPPRKNQRPQGVNVPKAEDQLSEVPTSAAPSSEQNLSARSSNSSSFQIRGPPSTMPGGLKGAEPLSTPREAVEEVFVDAGEVWVKSSQEGKEHVSHIHRCR